MTAPLRVGLLGYGWVNRTVWLPRVQAHPRLELAAVCDPEAVGAPAATSWEGLLDARPDVVVIGTPNHTHFALAAAVLERGIRVVVEKPLCLSRVEFDALAERARGVGVLVSRAAVRREDVRRLSGALPPGPLTVRASWLRAGGVPRPGSWFTGRATAGGGALLDLGWHVADVALGLLGRPRQVAVAAELRAPDGGHTPGSAPGSAAWRGDGAGAGPVDVEVDGTVRAEFADGSRLVLRAAWASEVTTDTTRFVVEGGGERRVLTGTFGFSPNRVAEPALTSWGPDSYRRITLPDHVGREYDAQVEAIAAFASGALDWEAELAESAAVMDLLEAAYRAAGRPLPVSERTAV
ncbi:Gfo/Idh/MocA family protein [Streptomyces sp. NRRL S-350]|uniref:Gfo/Idh/MocA family protein n=1 Tax=Streptomyces sp. NRRL S-350 TaxID=1463902 RepID=UPI00068E5F9F|nr:Gfo/Idh/MocA family oxidoreductase [Streptomyces sp. NRRL S-350]